jgi:acetyl-CoA C-acetyltransferase
MLPKPTTKIFSLPLNGRSLRSLALHNSRWLALAADGAGLAIAATVCHDARRSNGWERQLRDVFVAGVGQTPITKDPQSRGRHLGAAAVKAALADAEIEPGRIGALYVGNMLSGVLAHQQQLGGLIADYTGLTGIEAVTIEAACASGGAALRVAYQAVAGGMHDAVAVCGVERMTHVERDEVTRALATAADWELEGVCGESFLSLNATLMRAYMDKYGVTAERFAPFAITAHRNALTNPNALLHKPLDMETYLASRVVADPIRLFDVSPVCNGASAVILAAPHVVASLLKAGKVRIAGSALSTAPLALARRADPLDLTAVTSSTQQAMKQAGVGHDDIDLFEPHDAYTIMTALTLEAAGFAGAGAGLDYADSARIGLRGELPLATFGGLKARGHPVGASGCYQVVEAFLQLTQRAGANQVQDAAVALVQNIGGTGATVVTHVLTRES